MSTRATNKKRAPRKTKKKPGKRTKSKKVRWKKETTSGGGTIWSAPVPRCPGCHVVLGEDAAQRWIVVLYHEPTNTLYVLKGVAYRDVAEAKKDVGEVLREVGQGPHRVANREVGDVVLAAEQYFSAQQDELDLMKRGTPDELKRARERTKETKEALEEMTGANRELYGAMGGGAIGAALGALTGNIFAAAIGALAGSVVGSILARPSLPSERPGARDDDDDDGHRRGGRDPVIPFPRRPASRAKGYAANPNLKRSLIEL